MKKEGPDWALFALYVVVAVALLVLAYSCA